MSVEKKIERLGLNDLDAVTGGAAPRPSGGTGKRQQPKKCPQCGEQLVTFRGSNTSVCVKCGYETTAE